jgi:hypothetical protein
MGAAWHVTMGAAWQVTMGAAWQVTVGAVRPGVRESPAIELVGA